MEVCLKCKVKFIFRTSQCQPPNPMERLTMAFWPTREAFVLLLPDILTTCTFKTKTLIDKFHGVHEVRFGFEQYKGIEGEYRSVNLTVFLGNKAIVLTMSPSLLSDSATLGTLMRTLSGIGLSVTKSPSVCTAVGDHAIVCTYVYASKGLLHDKFWIEFPES